MRHRNLLEARAQLRNLPCEPIDDACAWQFLPASHGRRKFPAQPCPCLAGEPLVDRLGWHRCLLRVCGKSLCKPLARFLRRRHAAVDDHAACERDGRLGIDVLAVDGVAVSEASTRGILDAPRVARARPFDLRPNLAGDAQSVDCNLPVLTEAGLNDAIAAPVGGVIHDCLLPKILAPRLFYISIRLCVYSA